MREPHGTKRITLLTVGFSLTTAALALAQISVRLNGVPERLSFPLPDGTNQILTATTAGGQVKAAWLALTDAVPSSQRVMLTRIDESEYAINLGAREVYELLKAHGTHGQFRIFAQDADGTIVSSFAVRYTMHVVPERLDFPFDEVKLTIYQRGSKKLPGSAGALSISLGDISAGRVLVSVHGPDDEPVVDTTAMQGGDRLALALAEQEYVLRLDELVNLLIGHDYAVFTLMSRHRLEAQRIDALLRLIEKTDATFIRNEQELTGEAFATHLRRKREYSGLRNISLDDFIDNVASRSSTTGVPYQVKLPTGDFVDADTWLRQQVRGAATGAEDGNDATQPPEGVEQSDARTRSAPEIQEPTITPAEPRDHTRLAAWAVPIEREGLPNLHRVSDGLYRGAQPTEAGFAELSAMGIKTVVNLRMLHSDRAECELNGLGYEHIRTHGWERADQEIVEFLSIAADVQRQPVFVHCREGADRTGLMCAMYRVTVQGWAKDEAIREMTDGGFGFHPVWENLIARIRDADVAAIKREAGL